MGVNVGLSGNEKDAYGSQRDLALGEDPYSSYAPRLDLAYRLAEIANQYGAQENLMFGGEGYGGSFQNADQQRAQAAGQPYTNKPYGGWGGYGSGNPVMSWDPSGTRPGWNNGTPVYPPQSGGLTPYGGDNTLPPSGSNNGGGVPYGGDVTPPIGSPSGGGISYGGDVMPPIGGKGGGAPIPGYKPPIPTADSYTQSVGTAPAWQKYMNAPGANASIDRASTQAGAQVLANLEAAGVSRNRLASFQGSNIDNAIASGATPEALTNYYLQKFRSAGNGDINAGAYQALTNSHDQGRIGDDELASLKTAPQGQAVPPTPAPTVGMKTASPMGSAYEAFAPAMSQSVAPTGTAAASKSTDPMQQFWNTLQGGIGQITNSPAFKNWVSQQNWDQVAAGGKPPAKTTESYMTQSVPPSGANQAGKGLPDNPVPGTTYTDEDGNQWHWTGHAFEGGPAPKGGGGIAVPPGPDPDKPGGGGGGLPGGPTPAPHPPDEPNPDPEPPVDKPPITGANILQPQWGHGRFDFTQGSNQAYTPDAWSTAAPWRPEAPTGGLYGAFSELAGGALTPYENRIGEAWQGRAVNPVGWADQAYQNDLFNYQSGPGKGIDEAYGAYNRMLQGNGYSDAEKGAIEGSAVRGVTEGYQRGADEMRRQAARTGNANAAYAAMASGGANYGAQLGETNRQNQVKFADEAQRRQEVGGQGMTNVASLANQKAQFGLNQGSQYANELARRQETAIRGMGDYASYGRGLQQQGLSGLSQLLQQQQQGKQNTYAQIAALLNQGTGNFSYGGSSGWGVGAGVGAGYK